MGQVHTHQFHVETEEDLVTVQIGGEGSVPGGFAKLFNRIVDSEAWARLSDCARAAYIPLVRFADHRNQYRVQVGQAALMKYAGLSRSSIKRAIRDLLASRLVLLIEQGGVTADGRNESNLYQLMVPTDPRPRMIGGPNEPAAVIHTPSRFDTGAGSVANPVGGQARTPSRFSAEPPDRSPPDPEAGPARTATPAQRTPSGRVRGGPQLRSISETKDNNRAAKPKLRADTTPIEAPIDAAALLEENGVEAPVARKLSTTFPLQRIIDVVETMQFRRARGKCENPGGFIREALVKQWQTPHAVIEARAKAETRVRADAATRQSRQVEVAHQSDVDAEQRKVDQVVSALDDDELDLMAAEVLKKYDGNSAVLAVLTRKPPRDCRLMKLEIAAIMRG